MASQLQNILSALSQGKKPQQQAGGLQNTVARPPSQQTLTSGGLSTLSNLRQLIGRGGTNVIRPSSVTQTSSVGQASE